MKRLSIARAMRGRVLLDPYVVLAARMAICTLCLAPFVWSAWRRIDRQRGGWRWLVFSLVFNTLLAYGVAVVAYHVGLSVWG